MVGHVNNGLDVALIGFEYCGSVHSALQLTDLFVSLRFTAPEVVRAKRGYNNVSVNKADIYSLGSLISSLINNSYM